MVEILSCFGDPHYNTRRVRSGRGSGTLVLEHVEWLTAVRKLTMTCWHLRNMLFPLLWKYVEGCNLSARRRLGIVALGNGLHAQCSYLIRNPTVGAYVQYVHFHTHLRRVHEVSLDRIISVDLPVRTGGTPKDLMMEFVDCLVRLPNLRTLEIFDVSNTAAIATALERRRAHFPGIRELQASGALAEFIGRCPNVESVTAIDGPSVRILRTHGKELKRLRRVVGVQKEYVLQRELRYTILLEASSH